MLFQQLREHFIHRAPPLGVNALYAPLLPRKAISEDNPVTADAEPVIILQRSFQRPDIAPFLSLALAAHRATSAAARERAAPESERLAPTTQPLSPFSEESGRNFVFPFS